MRYYQIVARSVLVSELSKPGNPCPWRRSNIGMNIVV
jgi:hypothetical protein